ncbi:winged helix-turn-helix transcriptional regulator [Streptomyces sp. RFCAC02]|uniref:winged helix-turn-helix transcriptional regulator n=1 Tax=Streptomyces sp. RFCAC02 TaxID=2499143 RepID=UPI001F0F2B23|nr:winged helix-turn-helix transcriptional regulator [Streptomyces sp. RFCAC02]
MNDPDLRRVTETVAMLNARWTVWTLMTLAPGPLRYTEIKTRLPWLADGQLHPRLNKLAASGLVERVEHRSHHVTYGLTQRGADLRPALSILAKWGSEHLEKPLAPDDAGALRPRPVPAAEEAEDTLALISGRYATPILWTLKARGATSGPAVTAAVVTAGRTTTAYPQLRQLEADGLVEEADDGRFRLTATGHALAPVYQGLSTWAAGRPVGSRPDHPVWPSHQPPAVPRVRTGLTVTPSAVAPTVPAWRPGDLFSHRPVPPPARAAVSTTGPRR